MPRFVLARFGTAKVLRNSFGSRYPSSRNIRHRMSSLGIFSNIKNSTLTNNFPQRMVASVSLKLALTGRVYRRRTPGGVHIM